MERKTVKLSDGRIAHRFNVIGTRFWVYKVWERINFSDNSHSTITTFGRDWYGRIGTRRITDRINAMPVGDNRFEACDAWREAQRIEAQALIHGAFPETKAVKANEYGEIEITQ